MEHHRQPFAVADLQSKRDVFDCLKELRCKDGVDPDALPTVLLEYFELTLEEAMQLTQEWIRYNQAVLESFGIW